LSFHRVCRSWRVASRFCPYGSLVTPSPLPPPRHVAGERRAGGPAHHGDAPVRGIVLRGRVALVPLPAQGLVTWPPPSTRWAGFPPDVHLHTGRLCSAGSSCLAVPRRPRSYAALRLPAPIGHGSGAPCPWPPAMPALVLCLRADDTCACARIVRRRHLTGSPRGRHGSRRGEGLPGAWAVLCVRAMVEHPAGDGPLLAPLTARSLEPSRHAAPWASGTMRGCGAAWPLAPTLACLRFAGPIAEAVARLATGLGGFTLRRTGCAPAGRRTKFPEGIATSNSL
jgi:hypothetical protein